MLFYSSQPLASLFGLQSLSKNTYGSGVTFIWLQSISSLMTTVLKLIPLMGLAEPIVVNHDLYGFPFVGGSLEKLSLPIWYATCDFESLTSWLSSTLIRIPASVKSEKLPFLGSWAPSREPSHRYWPLTWCPSLKKPKPWGEPVKLILFGNTVFTHPAHSVTLGTREKCYFK